MFRFIGKLLLAILILLIIAIVAIYFYLGSVVKWGVEKYVPPITGTKVTVGSVNISLLKGTFNIKNLVIGNPNGFNSEKAISVGRIYVKMDVKSLTKPTIVIPEILIDQPQAGIEATTRQGLNLIALKKNVDRYLAESAQNATTQKTTDKKEAEKKVVIGSLNITNSSVKMFAFNQDMTVPLPNISKKNIGKSSSRTISQSIAEVLNVFTIDAVRNYAKAIENASKEVASKTVDATKNAVKAGSDGIKKGVNSLKNMF